MEKVVLFNPKLPRLSENEKKALKLLIEAGKLIAPIYKLQENKKYPGANFYPHDVTKKEIEKAAKKNPEILSPYTVVEKKNGELIATPYHVKYASLLKPVIDKLLQASTVTENKGFAKLLKLQAKALSDGSYDDAMFFWLEMKPTKLDILLGPIEKFEDRLFHIKTAYQAWVGIIDEKSSSEAGEFKEPILSARRRALIPSQKVDFYGRVKVRMLDTLLFSGFMAKSKFIGVFLPNRVEFIEKFGAKITLFKQVNNDRVKKEIIPSFNKFFSPSFRDSFTQNDLIEGNMTYVFLHELAHTYLIYRSAENRLQELYPIIAELSASVYGMKVGGSLLLKDMVTTKQLESIMISFMSRCLYLIGKQTRTYFHPHYVSGGTIFINYMMETGAMKFANGFSITNFMKVFLSINEFATILEKLLAFGTRKDAELFIKKYSKSLSL